MIKVQYLNPYNGRPVIRSFKTIFQVKNHIQSFYCPIPVLVEKDDIEFHAYYDPNTGWSSEDSLLTEIYYVEVVEDYVINSK